MKQKRLNVKGKEIAYYETRDNGSPVVLVHGLSSCSSVFIRQLIDSVLSYQYRFIAVDLIGFGNSDKSDDPEKDYTIEGLSGFLNEFCAKLEIRNAVYMGHDLGGNIILESYDQLNDPKGLVLLGSIPFSLPFRKESFTQDEIYKLLSKAGIDSSEVHQTASLFVDAGVNYPEFIPEIIRKADSKTREIVFKSLSEGMYKDQLNILDKINVPVAIYYGESDQMINTEYFENFTIPALWKDKIQEVKDAGHMFFYESPADFNISIETFLNTVFN